MVEVVRRPAKDLVLQDHGALTVAIDTRLTPDLIREGRMRELVHRLQNLRKEQGLAVTDRIYVEYCASPALEESVRAHEELICAETLARSLTAVSDDHEGLIRWDLDGDSFGVIIRPVSGSAGSVPNHPAV
jgi:isoleucyl-tRNA synthetase